MADFAILIPKIGDEPPQRKRKSEFPGSSSSAAPIRSFHKVECDSWDDEDYIDPAVEKEYWRQVLESDGFDVDRFALPDGGIYPYIFRDKYDYPYDIALFSRLGLHCYNLQKGTNLRLIAINKYNDEMLGRLFQYYITLEAMDTSNNSLCNFQTCVCQDFTPKDSSLMVQTELSRLKVPAGPRTTFIGPQRRWKDDAVDDSYKGKLPGWLTEQELSNKGQFYELQESDWQGNEWLLMYAEFALYSKFFAYGNDLRHFLPLEMKKIIVQTQENREASPHMILKANNAIFYISFKGNGDPSGTPMEYQAIVRRTMDGMPGHICLEVDCLAYKSC